MGKRIPTDTATKKTEFNPQKSYTWKAEDEFIIKGNELDFINKVINSQLNTPEAQRITILLQAKEVLNNLFKEAYDDGIITEYEEPLKVEEKPVKDELVSDAPKAAKFAEIIEPE